MSEVRTGVDRRTKALALAGVAVLHIGLIAALISAFAEKPVPATNVVFGEIALSGEVRPVSHSGLRLKESAKLGFERAWVPKGVTGEGITTAGFASLGSLVDHLLGRG